MSNTMPNEKVNDLYYICICIVSIQYVLCADFVPECILFDLACFFLFFFSSFI